MKGVTPEGESELHTGLTNQQVHFSTLQHPNPLKLQLDLIFTRSKAG